MAMSGTAADQEVQPEGYDAFICYNDEDKLEALRLKTELESEHLRAFEASSDLLPGDVWPEEIASVIGSARAALVVLGKSGGQRWAGLELTQVVKEHEKRAMRVIPVLVAGASDDPHIPLLVGFTRLDLRDHHRASFRRLLQAIRTTKPIKRPAWWEKHLREIALALGAVGAVALVAATISLRHQAKVNAAVAEQVDRLLAHYQGEETEKGVAGLLDLARREPDAVCPALAAVVDLPARHGYPPLTVEEVLSQIAGSPCSAHGDVQRATVAARERVRAALASPASFAELQQQLGPQFDCAALERLRRLLAVPGQPCAVTQPPMAGGGQ
jgi:hypothetical protein